MLIAYVVCALLVRGILSKNPLSASEKKEMLNKHNEYRAQEGACDMEKMIWDNDAESQAQKWADNCVYEHSGAAGYGENIYYALTDTDGTHFVTMMYDEKKDYNYDKLTCAKGKKCGHYTAMAWSTSCRLGCARAECSFGFFFVCNYAPPGNYRGKKPFKKGPAGSDCVTGFKDRKNWCKPDCTSPSRNCICSRTCKNGGTLNSKTCKCTCADGWMGSTCDDVCDNLSTDCGKGWRESMCDDYQYVIDGCPKLCKLCKPSCPGKTCKNGGSLSSSCDCECINSWSGDTCSECNLSCSANRGTFLPGECKCQCRKGSAGADCSAKCEDTHKYCGANPGWPKMWCQSSIRTYVKDYCPLLCGLCVPI